MFVKLKLVCETETMGNDTRIILQFVLLWQTFLKALREGKTSTWKAYSGSELIIEKPTPEVIHLSNYNRNKQRDEPIKVPCNYP